MIQYTDYFDVAMEEVLKKMNAEWLHIHDRIISIETINMRGEYNNVIRVWWHA